MRLEIDDPLSEKQWQAVENAAFRILEKTGILVPHADILSALAGLPGFHVDGETVGIEEPMVREQTSSIKGTQAYGARLMSGAYSHHFLDPDTRVTRSPTLQDLVTSVRQAEALGSAVCAPVVPLDIPGPRQELVMERVTHENSRLSFGAGQATSVVAAEAAMEMSAVVNRPYELELWIHSPLKLDPSGLNILWQLRHRRPRVRISNMPVRGMSSPISLSGVLAQTTAECLACAAVVAALDLAGGVTYRTDAFSSYAIDMRSTKVLVSGPDYLQLMVLSIFLARRYGIAAPMGKALMTASKCPDEQAAAEKATQALAAALAGAGTFTAAGTLSGVEVFSPVQMVIDHEIMSWVDACVRPLGFCDNDFALDEIDTVGPNGTFMDSPSTVRCFREVFWRPNIFSFSPFPAWLGEGRPMLAEKAHDKLRSMTLPDEPIIPKEQQRELRKIEERFASRLS